MRTIATAGHVDHGKSTLVEALTGSHPDRLAEEQIPVAALVVNRVHPRFTDALPEALRERAATLEGTDLGHQYENLADFALIAAREDEHLDGLAEQVSPAPIVRVPFLRSDVHDLDGLDEIASHLFP